MSKYFWGFDAMEIQTLAEEVSLLRLKEGDIVMKQGESASFVGLLTSGAAEVLIEDKQEDSKGDEPPKKKRVAVVKAGDLLGEMAMYAGRARTADIVTMTDDTVTATFAFEELNELSEQNPDLGLKLMRLFAHTTLAKLRLTATRRAPMERFPLNGDCTSDILFRMIQAAHAVGNGLGDDIVTSDIEYLKDIMYLSRFKPGETVIMRGLAGKHVLFILTGSLEIRIEGADTPLLGTKLNGEWVGEDAFFHRDYPLCERGADCFAAQDTAVAVISFRDLEKLNKEKPDLALKLYIRLGQLVTGRVLASLGKGGGGAHGSSILNAGSKDQYLLQDYELLLTRTYKRQMKSKGREVMKNIPLVEPIHRVIESDCTEEEIMLMLEFCWSFSPYWKGFSHNDLTIMAKEMTFLKVGDGTSILKHGESASFVAFLATGSADVIIGEDKVVASIEAGEVLGELAMFHQGVRMAGICSSNPGTVVGLMTFEQLLDCNVQYPELGLKFIKLCASASVSKLQSQVKRDPEVGNFEPLPPNKQAGLCESLKSVFSGAGMLEEIEADDLSTIASNMCVLDFYSAEQIIKAGDTAEVVMFVLKGQVDLKLGGANGRVVGTRNPGQIIGEQPFLETNFPDLCTRKHDAFATCKTTVGAVKYSAMEQLNITSTNLIQILVNVFAQQAVTRQQNLVDGVEGDLKAFRRKPPKKGEKTETLLKKRKKKKKASNKHLSEEEKKKLKAHKKANEMYLKMRKVKQLGKKAEEAAASAKMEGFFDPFKNVKSELDENLAAEKLMYVQRYSTYCRGLTQHDLEYMLTEAPVLVLNEGDALCKKGEPSSFVALIVEGKAEAIHDKTPVHTFTRGDFVGEQSAFETGGRAADVIVGKGGATVLILFLDRLANALYMKKPDLGLKIMKLFAFSCMSRTRLECLEREITNPATAERFKIEDCTPEDMESKLKQAHKVAQENGQRGIGEFSDEDFTEFAKYCMLATYKEKDRVVAKGTVGTSLAFVLTGMLSVHIDGYDSTLLGTCSTGTYIGEKAFIASQKGLARRSADIFAQNDVEIALISNDQLVELSATHPQLVMKVVRHIGNVVMQRLMHFHPSKKKDEDEEEDEETERKARIAARVKRETGNTANLLKNRNIIDVNDELMAVPPEEARDLLSTCQQYSTFWHGFLPEEIEELSSAVSILTLKAGDQYISSGDPADFVALQIRGTSSVIVGGDMVASIPMGELVGELSMFTGGHRTADIMVSSKTAKLAIFKIEDITLRGLTPYLAIKLVRLFASASLHKLSEHSQAEESFVPSICPQSTFYHMLQQAQDETKGLGNIPQHYIYTLSQNMFLVKVPKDTLILKKGTEGKSFAFVLSGAVDFRVDGPNSKIVNWKKKGEIVGENAIIESLVERSVRRFDTYASTDCQLAVMYNAKLEELNQNHPDLVQKMYTAIGMNFLKTEKEALDNNSIFAASFARLMIDGSVVRGASEVEALLRSRGVKTLEGKAEKKTKKGQGSGPGEFSKRASIIHDRRASTLKDVGGPARKLSMAAHAKGRRASSFDPEKLNRRASVAKFGSSAKPPPIRESPEGSRGPSRSNKKRGSSPFSGGITEEGREGGRVHREVQTVGRELNLEDIPEDMHEIVMKLSLTLKEVSDLKDRETNHLKELEVVRNQLKVTEETNEELRLKLDSAGDHMQKMSKVQQSFVGMRRNSALMRKSMEIMQEKMSASTDTSPERRPYAPEAADGRRAAQELDLLKKENDALKAKMENILRWSTGELGTAEPASPLLSPGRPIYTPMTPGEDLPGDWHELARENKKMHVANSLLLEQISELRQKADGISAAGGWRDGGTGGFFKLPVLGSRRAPQAAADKSMLWTLTGVEGAADPRARWDGPPPGEQALRTNIGWRRQHFGQGVREKYYSAHQMQLLKGGGDRKGRPRLQFSSGGAPL